MLLQGKSNGRRDVREIWRDEEIEYGMKEILNRYIYII